MSMDSAFRPTGLTVCVAATATTGLAPTQWSTGGMSVAFVSNGSSVGVWLAFGSSTVGAAIPTTANPYPGTLLPSSGYRAFTVGPSSSQNAWVSAVTTAGAGTANVFITPGIGF